MHVKRLKYSISNSSFMAKNNKKLTPTQKHITFKYATLPTSFFIASILGFLVSSIYLPKINVTWAFTLGLIFLTMLIASLISMFKAVPEPQLK